MNEELKQKLDKVLDLFNQKNYKEAEKKLLQLRRNYYDSSHVNYLLGNLYGEYDNPNKSKEKALHYYQLVIDSENPLERVFIEVIHHLSDKKQQVSILKKGLTLFPKSSEINERIIYRLNNPESIELYDSLKDKSFLDEVSNFIILIALYEEGLFDRSIEHAQKIQVKDKDNLLLKNLIIAYCNYKLGRINDSISLFKKLKESDLKKSLKDGPHVGLLSCYLHEKNDIKFIEILNELPYEEGVDPTTGDTFIPLLFSFGDIFIEVISEFEKKTKDKNVIAKIRALRGYYFYILYEIKQKTINDLKYANKNLPYNKKICTTLKEIFTDRKQHLEAYKYGIQYLKTADYHFRDEEPEIDFSFIKNANKSDFEEILDDFKQLANRSTNLVKEFISKSVLNDIIKRLHNDKSHKEIIEIVNNFSSSNLKESKIQFEIAYAFSKENGKEKAKEFYEMSLKKNPDSSASANNLALIYEDLGDLKAAKTLFLKAVELDPEDKISRNNLDRVEEKCVNFERSFKNFQHENIWIKNKLLSFSKYKNNDKLIACSYNQLPKYLSVSALKSADLIKSFLEKEYVFKVTEHSISTSSNVYQINPLIENYLIGLENEIEEEKELIDLAESMNSKTLLNLGYNEKLLNSLSKVTKVELRDMLKRDLRENVIALITKNYKTVLIMSGSIIEALLLDKLSFLKISSYTLHNGKKKKLLNMTLNDLLYVANNKKIIGEQLYHLAHALRGFRNLIHPGVEQRKLAMKINNTNANLAWDITKKIILEI